MAGCPRGSGRDCGCDSELETESDCDPCTRGGCREWQRTPNFVRSLPARYLDPCDQQTLRNVRFTFVSAVGSLVVGGWAYHKYLHFVAAKEAAKKKKARTKPKEVKCDHLKSLGPSLALVPEESNNIESKGVGFESGFANEGNNNKGNCNLIFPLGAITELERVEGTKHQPIGNNMDKNDKLRRNAKPVISPEEENKNAHVETGKEIKPTSNPDEVKHDRVNIVHITDQKLEVKKESNEKKSKIDGCAPEEGKKDQRNNSVHIVVTPGKQGKHVKRRGWK